MTSSTWILILFISYRAGFDHIEFHDRRSCELAAAQVVKEIQASRPYSNLRAICVAKGKP